MRIDACPVGSVERLSKCLVLPVSGSHRHQSAVCSADCSCVGLAHLLTASSHLHETVSTQSNRSKSHQELLADDVERSSSVAWRKHVVLTVRSYDQSWIMPSAEQPTNGKRQPYEPKDPIYDPYRRTDRYGIMGKAPQPWTEYARLILLGVTLVPIKAVVCFGELFTLLLTRVRLRAPVVRVDMRNSTA